MKAINVEYIREESPVTAAVICARAIQQHRVKSRHDSLKRRHGFLDTIVNFSQHYCYLLLLF